MGPRLFRRGNIKREAEVAAAAALQWGHVFSDVEIEQTGQMIIRQVPASMGPRLFRRGNSVLLPVAVWLWRASMGPRLFRRGNELYERHYSKYHYASMGPRLFRRGNQRLKVAS